MLLLFALFRFEHLILIKICLIDICFLLNECGIHCLNTADYCMLKSPSMTDSKLNMD